MHRRTALALLAGFACAPVTAGVSRAEQLGPDVIFARAKDSWRRRDEAPYLVYSLRERYTWRSRVHDNWWQVSYRNRDRNLALRRIVVPAQEEERLRGAPIALNIHVHNGKARADSLDTNPSADAFPILDPLIEPNASFGLLRSDPRAALAAGRLAGGPPAPGVSAAAEPSPVATPVPGPSTAATDKPLRELAHVEAVARDYTIELAGTERLRGNDTFHLTLAPLRDPRVYRLRELWVDTATFATVQLAVQGLFEGRPYDDARWIVTYVPLNGRFYVQQIHTDESLRFGLDRVVTGLQYDFVQYDFPSSLPDVLFQRLL